MTVTISATMMAHPQRAELAEQIRSEISSHGSKTNELQATLERINQYEGDLNYQISISRESLWPSRPPLSSTLPIPCLFFTPFGHSDI